MSESIFCIPTDAASVLANDCSVGTCALCGAENVALKRSHSIPKFVFDWIKETSRTPYLRDGDDVNVRHQDGPKQYLLGEVCEGTLAVLEKQLAEGLFRKIANYRKQQSVVTITEGMRVAVLSIFWRSLLTTIHRDSSWTTEDRRRIDALLASMKADIRAKQCSPKICIAPFYGEPPYYGLPRAMTYFLERSAGGQDVRFFDDPHRYFVVFRLPFMYFYIFSEGWTAEDTGSCTEFCAGDLDVSQISEIPIVLKNYIEHIYEQYSLSLAKMDERNVERIRQESSQYPGVSGSDKSAARSVE